MMQTFFMGLTQLRHSPPPSFRRRRKQRQYVRQLRLKLAAVTVIISTMLISTAAHAGRNCEAKKPTVRTVERGLMLAERTLAALDASGHQVVLLARAGQDLTKYGVRYSHLGFAYRQSDSNGAHVWRVLHKLNHCGSDDAAIYRQGLGQFFLDDLWRHEAAFVAPAMDMQARLLPLLQNATQATVMHQRRYSIVSYVWGRQYQQSNQWAIETLSVAMMPAIATRAQAQAWLQLHDYQPATLRLGPLTRLGGRITSANVAFDDHPSAKRFSDRIETVTVDSVFSWMHRSGLGAMPVQVRLHP